ncbi:uncharacterized protein LOC118187871 [Stegodyphus dumicola]|uniref:uncharacterized protein LOC118187871 n=1 Tax=Stegodyphus dumicola TaxID=202533 RepID=UPI0015B377EF|nr:uncharacterized protein LOC118187871 [Stegodyphus dumicola]
MVMRNASSGHVKTYLSTLYDDLETKIRALESLGRTQEVYGDFLTPLVESRLPKEVLIAWERNRNLKEAPQPDDSCLENLMNFLKQKVKGEEVVLACTGLIEYFHRENCHAGTQILLSILREKYWITRGRRAIRSVLKDCIKCRRYKTKSLITEPVSLPADRVENAAAFEVVGIDLAGPLFVKRGDKVWMVLYTCALYRAIHLELITSLSTDAFLLSFRRFVARRGRPRVVYTDNGTNFRGAYNNLLEIDWSKVTRQTEIQKIEWKFIPPTAAWWGGWWERLVRVVKELLRRTLGRAVLTYEELETVMCECERVVNSRPLTYLSEDTEDLVPLTPAMFLTDRSNLDVTDIDTVDTNHLRKRIRFRAKLMEDLRVRFRKEYLGLLIQKRQQNSQFPNIRVNDVVLIGDDIKRD